MGSLSKIVPIIKEPVSSQPQNSDEVNRLQKYPVKLMQHEQDSVRQLAHKINQVTAEASSAKNMLQEIAQLLGLAFEVDCCCLVTMTDEGSGEAITANWCIQESLEDIASTELLSTEQLGKPEVQCAAEPFTIDDISVIENSLIVGCQHLKVNLGSVLAIPTRFAGKNNGVVILIESKPHTWSYSDKKSLQTVAASCAIAFAQVAQSNLIDSQQQYVQTCAQHQSLIKQLTLLSRSNLELNQMLQLIVSATAEAIDADRGFLILLKYTNPIFRNRSKKVIPKAKANVVASWSENLENCDIEELASLEKESFLLSDCGLCKRAFNDSGKAVVINDNTDRRKDTSTIAPVFAMSMMSALLLIPLESQGRVLGFLAFQQKLPRCWQPAELNIVEMVCAQISNTIIQTQTLRQVQTLVEERTAQLQRSLDVQAKLYEKTRQYVQQLRELNELKDEFLSNLSDRLRYPLTNMRMSLRLLRKPAIEEEQKNKYLDILEQECTKEINLVNDLLTLQQLENRQEPLQLESINLNSKVQELVSTFDKQLADKSLNLILDLPEEELTLQTEVESFDRILKELLSNTCKYSTHETDVGIKAFHKLDQQIDRIIIEVTNVGRGISEEEGTYIFDKFRRGKGRWTPGTGLGLALAKSLIQHLSGTISVESTAIADSELSKICFTLDLPQFSEDVEIINRK
ncbi:MAG: GAF domain-containing sensor histidine kinase [Cyanobacteria bacterium P01_A01_bin.45]